MSEEDIAPTDIFKYEIISDAETGATSLDSLPTKEARITGIKEKYCNYGGYTAETGEKYEDTNYEITLEDGTKITDTLVIPYQVEIDGEMYKITEANIFAYGNGNHGDGYLIPRVETIIYPNTIKKIYGEKGDATADGGMYNTTLKNIIFSKNLKQIGEDAFYACKALINIHIPNSVTSLESFTFGECISLTSIEIPNSVTSIGNYAFWICSNLTSINIPSSVTSIGDFAFSGCSSLTNVKIPSSITSIGWSPFSECDKLTTVNYTGTMAQWQQISGRNELSGVQIVCTDGTINQ